MLLALTTNQKLGLAGTAVVFIAFALLSALVIPRFRPDFPGRRGVVLFVLVTAILTIGMLTAVEVFAKEAEHGAETTAETTQTETQATTTSPTPPPPPPTATKPSGSPEAGKPVFLAQGCGNCHTFTPGGTTGKVCPNLDDALKGKDAAFVRQSIVDPNAEIAPGYQPGVMPQTYKDQLSPKQLDDLVAFLTSS